MRSTSTRSSRRSVCRRKPREFFSVDDRAEPGGRFGVLLVLEGEGELAGERVRPGDAFVLPAACEPFEVRGDIRVIRCLGGSA